MNQRERISYRSKPDRKTFRRACVPDVVLKPATILGFIVWLSLAPAVSQAQVTTSITSTTGVGNLGTNITQAGNVYNITGGTRPGGGPNLFHSFGNFSIGAGDIGNFLNNTGLATSNILGRVTGGNISNIYGTIQTTGFGNANLFLMNPFGIVLGPSASLNVGGSVSFTTAQYLRLFDGVSSANFYANPANDGLANSILTIDPSAFEFLSAAPAAYGFLTAPDPSATITVQGSALSAPPGQSISLVGGNISIQGFTRPDGTVQPAQLSAPNGTIQLASAASPGEFTAPAGQSLANATTLQSVPNNPVDPASATSFTSYGLVSMTQGSSIDVHGASSVWIKGGQLVLSINDATLNTSPSPAPPDTVLLSSGSTIVTSTSGAEDGPDVQITVRTLSLDGAGTAITTQTMGDGNGGNIRADVGTLSLTNGAMISSTNPSFGLGQGGNIALEGLQGPGSAADFVTLSSGASIISTTAGLNPGGNLQITSKNIQLHDAGTALITETDGDGNAGNLTLNVGTLALNDAAAIFSNNFSFGLGQGGNVTVQGLQGPGSAADSVTLSNGSTITTQTFAPGASGDLHITAGTLSLDGAGTSLTTATFGDGNGGTITADVGTLSLTNGAAIFSNNFSFGLGQGGNIIVEGVQGPGSAADSVMLSGISTITTQTFAPGASGDLHITAGTLSLDGVGTSLTTATFGDGNGGTITADVGTLSLTNGAAIFSVQNERRGRWLRAAEAIRRNGRFPAVGAPGGVGFDGFWDDVWRGHFQSWHDLQDQHGWHRLRSAKAIFRCGWGLSGCRPGASGPDALWGYAGRRFVELRERVPAQRRRQWLWRADQFRQQ